MRLRALLLTTAPLLMLSVACGDDDGPTQSPATGTAIGTATPYAVTPTPIIVTGANNGGGTTSKEIKYVVVSGDTLLGLATRYDTTVEAIMKRNNLVSASELKVGQELIISSGTSSVATPGPTASKTPTPAATARPSGTASAGQTYEVKSGDLAGAIAARFGITLEQLAAANNRSVASLDQLQVGDQLVIPGR